MAIVIGEATSPGLPAACRHVSPWPDRPCRAARPTAELARRRRARLREVIRRGVRTTTPHDGTTVAGVFEGNYDWHSAVHGYWALLSMARVTRNRVLETQVMARFTDAALRRERSRLAANASFELPYGRAWLLLLLDELGRRPGMPAVVASLRQDTEKVLLDWLNQSPYPEGSVKPGSRGFSAVHGSWLFTYLLFVLSRPRSSQVRQALRVLRRTKLEPQRAKLAQVVHGPGDFLYLPAIQAVIDRVDPASGRTVRSYPVVASPSLACPPLDSTNAHSAGAAVVHLWPYAIQTRAGREAACSRYYTRLAEIFGRPDQWEGSFRHVSHWVPQFIWMALWLEAGRP